MRIDPLHTVDVRFHHDFEAQFEQLNQGRVKSRAKVTSEEVRLRTDLFKIGTLRLLAIT